MKKLVYLLEVMVHIGILIGTTNASRLPNTRIRNVERVDLKSSEISTDVNKVSQCLI